MNALNSILSYIQRPGSIKTLEDLGIEMFADTAKTQFRNVLDIFKDIASNWNTLSADIKDGFVKSADDAGLFTEEIATALGSMKEWNDLQQRDISQAAAGVYRRNYFIGMIERLSDVQGVLNNLMEAEGHSMRENEKTMETLEKKTESFKTSIESLAVAVGETGLIDVLKLLVDAGTGAIEMFNKLPDEIQKPILAFAAMSAIIKTGQLAFGLYGISVNAISTALGGLTASAGAAANATTILGLATNHWVLILAGAAAVGSLIYTKLKDNNQELEKSIDVLKNSDALDDYISKYEELASKTELTTEEQKNLLEVKEKIKTLIPETASAIDSENLSLEEQLKILKHLNEEQKQNAMNEATSTITEYGGKEESLIKEIKGNEEGLKRLREARNELLKKQADGVELTRSEKKELKDLQQRIDITSKALNNNKVKLDALRAAIELINTVLNGNTEVIEENTNATDEGTKSNQSHEQSLEELNKKFNEATDKIADYNNYLKEYNKTGTFSGEVQQEIIDKYPALLGLLADERSLRDALQEALNEEKQAQIDLFFAKIETSEDFINTRIKGEKTLREKLAEYYEIDLQNANNLAQAKSKVEEALISSFTKQWGTYYDIQADAMTQDYTLLETLAQQTSMDNNPYADQLQAIDDAVNQFKDKSSKFKSVAMELSGFDFTKINSSNNKSYENKTKEPYQAETDGLLKYRNAIEETSHQLSLLKSNQKLETDDLKNITLLQKQNELLEIQKQNVHDLANEQRKQRDLLEQPLSKQGFKFEGEGDNKFITNLENVKGKSKEVEAEFEKFIDLQIKEIPSAKQQWWGLQESIVGNGDAITQIIQTSIDELEKLKDELNDLDVDTKIKELNDQLDFAKFQNGIDKIILKTGEFASSIDLLKYKLNLFDSEDFENRADVVSDMFSASKKQARQLGRELERLSNITPKNAKEADALASAMSQVQQQMKQSYTETREFQRMLEKLQVDAISSEFNKATKQLEFQMQMIDNSISSLQNGILPDFSLDMIMPIPDFSDIFDSSRSENEKLYNEQKDYEEQIQDLKRYSLDQQLKDAETFYRDEINKLMEHYDNLAKQISEKSTKIYELKEFANEEQKTQLDTINSEIEQKLSTSNEAIITSTDIYLDTLKTSYENVWSSIVGTVDSSVASIMNAVASAKNAMASLNSGGSTSSSSGSSSNTSSIGVSNQSKYLDGLIKSGDKGQKKWAENEKKLGRYAKGTDGHEGGLAVLGDEFKGAYELAILPSGKTMVLGKTSAELVDLPAGTQVIPHDETKDILSYTGNIDGQTIPKYAKGTIDTPDFLAEMSKQFKRGTGKYDEGMFKQLDFKGYDKYLKDRKKTLEEIANLQADYLKGIDNQISKEEILSKIDDQLLKDTRTQSWLKVDMLEQMKSNVDVYVGELKDQYDKSIANGNVELSREIFEEYNNMLSKSIQVENQIQQAIKQRYELEFALIDKKIDKEKEAMDELEYQMSLKTLLNPDDASGINDIYGQMISNQQNSIENLYTVLNQLREQQGLLEVGSAEWGIIGSKISSVISQIRQANLAMAQNAKNRFGGYLGSAKEQISSANPVPSSPKSSKDDSDKWLEGREKELEIQKLMNYVEENNLELNEKQLALINSREKIRKSELDIVQKELEFQQLQVKLENLRNQKTIQQLKQREDGTWDYAYVVDEDAIRDTQEQMIDAELGVINSKKTLEKELQQEREEAMQAAQESAEKHYDAQMDLLDKTLTKAENRMYKSAEEFRKALESINLNLPIDEMVNEYWDYFLETATIFINEALDITKLSLKSQMKEFENTGDEAGRNYVQGLLDSIDDVMNGEGDIMQKQQSIIDMFADKYTEFALAGNKSGIAFIDGLIDSMGTEDYVIAPLDIVTKMISQITGRASELEQSGQLAGSSLLKGLSESIDNTVIAEQLKLLNKTITDEVNKYFEDSQIDGSKLIKTIENTITHALKSGELDGLSGKLSDALTNQLENMRIDKESYAYMFVNQIASALGNSGNIMKILEGHGLTNINDIILSILDETNKYGNLGQALGQGFMDGLMSTFTTMASQVTGEGEGALSEAINAITSQLDNKIIGFAEKGDLQGVAYAEALKNKLQEAMTNAELTQEDIIALLSQYKDFDLAGLLSGDAYENAILIGFGDAEKTTDEKSNAIIDGLNEDVSNFGEAGKNQGEAYKESITSAFESAISIAKGLVGNLVDYINSQQFGVKVGVSGDTLDGIQSFSSGGYTGNFNGGKLGILHEKELILNQTQTKDFSMLVGNMSEFNKSVATMPNLLKGINLADNIANNIQATIVPKVQPAVQSPSVVREQIIHNHIKEVVFPGVKTAEEIEKAWRNIPNRVKQKTK